MINNIEGKGKKILKVLLGINVIFFILLLFYTSKGLMISSILINIVFIGSVLVIEKYGEFFGLMIQTQKSARGLNNLLGKLNG